LTVAVTSARRAGQLGQLVSSQLAGIALAVFMIQHGAARSRQRPYAD
jgi:hypothetical protein